MIWNFLNTKPEHHSLFLSFMKKTPYQILGVEPNAGIEVIRKEYLRLCRVYHPDHLQQVVSSGHLRFLEIQQAWETLRDPQSREHLDLLLNNEEKHIERIWHFDDLGVDQGTDTYWGECRCGSKIFFDSNALVEEDIVYSSCQGCSLRYACQISD